MKAKAEYIVWDIPTSERMEQIAMAKSTMNISSTESTDLEDTYPDWVLIRFLAQRGYEVKP